MLIRSKPTKDHFTEDKRLETKPRHEKCNISPTNAWQNGVLYEVRTALISRLFRCSELRTHELNYIATYSCSIAGSIGIDGHFAAVPR